MWNDQAEKMGRNGQMAKTAENRQQLIRCLKREGSSKAADIAGDIRLSSARVRILLSELSDEGRVRTEGNGRSRV